MVNAHRKALESLWRDRCTVYGYQEVTDPDTHLTDFAEVAILTDEPCKLSFEKLAAASGEPVAAISQGVTLFLSPDVTIQAGSKVVVTRPNEVERVFTYACSGEPGIFTDHQEIHLTPWKGWA